MYLKLLLSRTLTDITIVIDRFTKNLELYALAVVKSRAIADKLLTSTSLDIERQRSFIVIKTEN